MVRASCVNPATKSVSVADQNMFESTHMPVLFEKDGWVPVPRPLDPASEEQQQPPQQQQRPGQRPGFPLFASRKAQVEANTASEETDRSAASSRSASSKAGPRKSQRSARAPSSRRSSKPKLSARAASKRTTPRKMGAPSAPAPLALGKATLAENLQHREREMRRPLMMPPALPNMDALARQKDEERRARLAFAAQKREAGHSAPVLKSEGFTAAELKQTDFTLDELWDAGYSVPALRTAGFSPRELKRRIKLARRVAATTAILAAEEKRLQEEMVPSVQASTEQTVEEEAPSTPHLSQLAPLMPRPGKLARLRDVDFLESVAEDERGTRLALATQKKEAGHSAPVLKREGFTAPELKQADFTLDELWDAGYSVPALTTAGFSHRELKQKKKLARRTATANAIWRGGQKPPMPDQSHTKALIAAAAAAAHVKASTLKGGTSTAPEAAAAAQAASRASNGAQCSSSVPAAAAQRPSASGLSGGTAAGTAADPAVPKERRPSRASESSRTKGRSKAGRSYSIGPGVRPNPKPAARNATPAARRQSAPGRSTSPVRPRRSSKSSEQGDIIPTRERATCEVLDSAVPTKLLDFV